MQWVFIIGDSSVSTDSFSDMEFCGSVRKIRDKDWLEIGYADKEYAVFEEYTADMKAEFEPLGFERYLRQIPFAEPKWFMLRYSSIEILKRIIGEKDFPANVMIDCDGTDLGLGEIIDESRIIENNIGEYNGLIE